jgi:hypothetical protein
MDKLEIKRALLYNKPSILDSRSGGNQCFDTQAHRSSHLRYFRSPQPILLARIVWLVAKFCIVCPSSVGQCIVCPSSFGQCIVCPSSVGQCIVCPSSFGRCIVCPSSIYPLGNFKPIFYNVQNL